MLHQVQAKVNHLVNKLMSELHLLKFYKYRFVLPFLIFETIWPETESSSFLTNEKKKVHCGLFILISSGVWTKLLWFLQLRMIYESSQQENPERAEDPLK